MERSFGGQDFFFCGDWEEVRFISRLCSCEERGEVGKIWLVARNLILSGSSEFENQICCQNSGLLKNGVKSHFYGISSWENGKNNDLLSIFLFCAEWE